MTMFKPMLAVNSKPEDVTKDSFASIKYEGVRLECTPELILTRSLKPFANSLLYEVPRLKVLQEVCAENKITIEGELYIHKTPFRELQSITTTDGDERVYAMQLQVFDAYREDQPDAPFEQRYAWYKWIVEQVDLRIQGDSKIYAVHQERLTDPLTQIPEMYAWAIENDFEGICIKAAEGPNKNGRSTLKQGYFTRIKPERDYDCIVLDVIERQNNLLESEVNELGYLKKRQDKDAKAGAGIAQTAIVYTPELDKIHKVSLTRNIKDEQETEHSESRRWLWENRDKVIGRCMRFVGIPVPGNDVPRSPRFDDWRLDMHPWFIAHDESDCLVVTFDQEVMERNLDAGCVLLDDINILLARYQEGYKLGI